MQYSLSTKDIETILALAPQSQAGADFLGDCDMCLRRIYTTVKRHQALQMASTVRTGLRRIARHATSLRDLLVNETDEMARARGKSIEQGGVRVTSTRHVADELTWLATEFDQAASDLRVPRGKPTNEFIVPLVWELCVIFERYLNKPVRRRVKQKGNTSQAYGKDLEFISLILNKVVPLAPDAVDQLIRRARRRYGE